MRGVRRTETMEHEGENKWEEEEEEIEVSLTGLYCKETVKIRQEIEIS